MSSTSPTTSGGQQTQQQQQPQQQVLSPDGKKVNLKEASTVEDFNKDDANGWDFGGSIRVNTLHKNDVKRGNLIDEISDLRNVLRKSVMGPLSRELLTDKMYMPPGDDEYDLLDAATTSSGGGGGDYRMPHSRSNVSISSMSSSRLSQHQSVNEEEIKQCDAIESELSELLTNKAAQEDVPTITINKEKLVMLMKDYKRSKDVMKVKSSLIQEMDNELCEVRGDLELKKKKIQILKSAHNTIRPSAHQHAVVEQQQQQPPASSSNNNTRMSNGTGTGGRVRSSTVASPHDTQSSGQRQQHESSSSSASINTSINNLLQQTTSAPGGVISEDINSKIVDVLNTAKYRIERIQFKNRMLLTSKMHTLSNEIHQILDKRITKKQVNIELVKNSQIVADCDERSASPSSTL
ncbi:hypothetical protein SAMD00019534_060540 [Acytostelium subglobosum LB1]|uniref:hypothetical protein n=1 Tax=Acytostelium subglobosum LB1 TaxID=1410327 RepID=UPI000644D08B|nr:hypothetical protein SAMD00019534_060540 [Acytostelium subglobosum LB1]GAM22879.1 hypothetical protein SAMD00019534_060540 [Acytostelium subglobosum LB1]|eukprot:XP_012754106.1 hypothetical protein SAMD00019534_060540 [Acytostelium subglobosum LB1]